MKVAIINEYNTVRYCNCVRSSIMGEYSIRLCRSVYCINEYPVGYIYHYAAGIVINAKIYTK